MKGYTGYTLIELVMVMAILAILAAVITPIIVPHGEDARRQAWKQERGFIQSAVDQYNADKTTYPIEEVDGVDVIQFSLVVDEGFLFNVPESSDQSDGSYVWFLQSNGRVESMLASDNTKIGYVTGVWP